MTIVVLGLGIGATTAVFSVIDVVLLRPLPYANAGRLVQVQTENAQLRVTGGPASYTDFLDWRAAGIFEDAGTYLPGNVVVRTGDGAERLPAASASASLFSTLGVEPLIGRLPTPDEDRPGPQPVVLLNESTWRRRFSSDPTILNRTVDVDGRPLSVIGVLPATFTFPGSPEVWTTFNDDGDLTPRDNRFLEVIARTRVGVSAELTTERLSTLCAALDQTYGSSNRNWRAAAVPWQESRVGGARPQLMLLAGSVCLVLLLACGNVAMLLLVRGARRVKEMAMRSALGAGRGRVVSQLLTECIVLSFASGGLGVSLAAWWVSLFARFGPRDIPRLSEAAMDSRVLVFALAVSCAAVLLFGVAPALRGSRPDVSVLLQESGRSSTPGRQRRALGQTLLIAETAISMVLVVGSVLLVRSFVTLVRVDSGFRTDHLLTFHLPLPATKYLDHGEYQRAHVREYFQDVLASLEARPDVESAAATLELPLGGGGYRVWQRFEMPGHPETASGKAIAVSNSVSAGFFRTMEIRVMRGRGFMPSDSATSAPVVVVSDAFAKKFLLDRDPIGQSVRTEGDSTLREIVGVVGDVKPDGLDSDPNPTIYVPFAQVPKPFMAVVVRTRAAPAVVAASLGRFLLSIDPDVPPYRVRSAEDLVSRSLGARKFGTALMAAFAATAVLLALVGLYAVTSHLVTQSTREIGIRVALGASRADVLHTVLGRALGPASIGLAVGVCVSLTAASTMTGLLFGIGPLDPAVIVAVPVVLAAGCVLACVIPARRILSVDPVIALRAE
jgi:putative ABC transport system permease protein